MNKTEMYNKLSELASKNLKPEELKAKIEALAEETKPKTKPRGVVKRVFVTAVPGVELGKCPGQMKRLYKLLCDRNVKGKQLQRLHEELDSDKKVVATLDTVQLPRTIYRFYQKRLIDAGALKHEVKEIKS